MQLCRSSHSKQLWGENGWATSFEVVSILTGPRHRVWISLNFLHRMWRASAGLLTTNARGRWERAARAETNTDEALLEIPQHGATIQGYHGNQIGWGRSESDSEGLTWQVKGTDGGASSTELYVESRKTLTHPRDEVTSVSRVQRRSEGTRQNILSSNSHILILIYRELFLGVLCPSKLSSLVKTSRDAGLWILKLHVVNCTFLLPKLC